jgi:dihydrofolate synthase/folylpolyglutamate synthase
MSGRSLNDWLLYQESLHPNPIDLGLDRVRTVWQRLVADDGELTCPIIVVGGTNGKGSTIAYIETIYNEAGYKTVVYTSPHIDKYNERVRITGTEATDEQLIEAFERIDSKRADISLSYFEFGTLAALSIAQQEQPDVLLLEVGLGGRLDAVNILQHDVAVVTSISMDHMEWLGNDLADIAIEKAGIARQGRPLIIGDTDMPQSLFDAARDIGAEVMQPGQNIANDQTGDSWAYHFGRHQYGDLPLPGIAGAHQLKNAAAAICAVNCLESRLPVKEGIIKSAIANTRLVGRFEKVSEQPPIYLDVGHNPAASSALREMLGCLGVEGNVVGVMALQKNREIEPFIQPLVDVISIWHVANMANGMGHEAVNLAGSITKMNPEAQVRQHVKIADAIGQAQQDADERSCIIVFGSFYTVSEARAALLV